MMPLTYFAIPSDHIFQKKTQDFVNVYQMQLNLLQHCIILVKQLITGRLLTC